MVYLRDTGCLVIGWGLMIHEAVWAQARLELMGFYLLVAVAPGMLASHFLGQSAIESPSSPPPQDASSSSSSSPSAPS